MKKCGICGEPLNIGIVVHRECLDKSKAAYDKINDFEQSQLAILLAENAELKKRLENAVELPCKVGDTIYIPWKFTDDDGDVQSGIAFPQITSIVIQENGTIMISTNLEIDDCGYMEEYADHFASGKNKHWFLTREQAEERLKEMNK